MSYLNKTKKELIEIINTLQDGLIKANDELSLRNLQLEDSREEVHKTKNSECVLSLREQRIKELISPHPYKLPTETYQKIRRMLQMS